MMDRTTTAYMTFVGFLSGIIFASSLNERAEAHDPSECPVCECPEPIVCPDLVTCPEPVTCPELAPCTSETPLPAPEKLERAFQAIEAVEQHEQARDTGKK
jgi:hypothetical protein